MPTRKGIFAFSAIFAVLCLAAGGGEGRQAREAEAPAAATGIESVPAENVPADATRTEKAPADGFPAPGPDKVAERLNSARARFGFPDRPDLVDEAIDEDHPYRDVNDNPLMFPATPKEIGVIETRLGKMHAGALYVQQHVIGRSDIGGIWYDFESGGVTHIALADVEPAAVLPPVPDEANVQFHAVERTRDELDALNEAVVRRVSSSDIVRLAEVDIDLPTNKVVISVIVDGGSTIKAARELLDDIISQDSADFVEGVDQELKLLTTTYGG